MEHFDTQAAEVNASRERRDQFQRGNRLLGRVIACNGARAIVSASASQGDTSLSQLWSVGRLVTIQVGENRIAGLVYGMQTDERVWNEGSDNVMRFEVELVGELRSDDAGHARFSAGISSYPYLGAVVHAMRSEDLKAIHDLDMSDVAVVGKLTQDETMDATIHIPSLLQRHFAVVGTTGVGKSSAVTLILDKLVRSDERLRVMILDPHNEFAAAFPDASAVLDTETLDLPFWLFRMEELVDVIFHGRVPVAEEVDVLRELIPEAKRAFNGEGESNLFRKSADRASLTADTPLPYRMADLLALVDERIGRLEGREEKPYLRQIRNRLLNLLNDTRFRFMFSSTSISDSLAEIVTTLFRPDDAAKPITTVQLSGIPSEVVDSVASVLCRLAFEVALWSRGAMRILTVCEEAHRYVPADPARGFLPTRQAIARIAKEGRKYGASLAVITQRPGELDPTILSQCSTVFAMRLSNEEDQAIIRSALPDSSISTTSFLSSIGNCEAIAFGEAVPVPMRLRFSELPPHKLPHSTEHAAEASGTAGTIDVQSLVRRMRALPAAEEAAAPAPSAPAGTADPYMAGPANPKASLPASPAPTERPEREAPRVEARPARQPGFEPARQRPEPAGATAPTDTPVKPAPLSGAELRARLMSKSRRR
ncbi:ATP-binding protein [Pararhizobium mangrovi]|uniref:ATP-binding protein n=1 Tax=Pararhizobium mangrovi TaxID=2590452 RepID=UPI001F3359E8|nr:ATP-binding protein [Pararhizobium mangrovi]